MACVLKAPHRCSGMAIALDVNHTQKAFLGFVCTSMTWVMLFRRSWFCAILLTMVMMASSTGVMVLFLLVWLDRPEVVGVIPDGPCLLIVLLGMLGGYRLL